MRFNKKKGEKMRLDLLNEKIKESGKTMVHLANAVGITREAFYKKLSGEFEFKLSEMNALVEDLRLTKEERDKIFFNEDSE